MNAAWAFLGAGAVCGVLLIVGVLKALNDMEHDIWDEEDEA